MEKEKEKEKEKGREKFRGPTLRDRGIKIFIAGMERYAIEDFYESGEPRGRFEVLYHLLDPPPKYHGSREEEDERQCLAFIWNAHNLQGGATEWHFTRRYCALELYLSRVESSGRPNKTDKRTAMADGIYSDL